jgi:hypothetical protein
MTESEFYRLSHKINHSDENQYRIVYSLGSPLTIFSRKYNSSRLQIGRSLVGPGQSAVVVFVPNESLGGDPVHG